jgi:hypothetical protein
MPSLRFPYVLIVVVVMRGGDNPVGNKERGEETDAEMSYKPDEGAFLDRLHELPPAGARDCSGLLMRSDLVTPMPESMIEMRLLFLSGRILMQSFSACRGDPGSSKLGVEIAECIRAVRDRPLQEDFLVRRERTDDDKPHQLRLISGWNSKVLTSSARKESEVNGSRPERRSNYVVDQKGRQFSDSRPNSLVQTVLKEGL